MKKLKSIKKKPLFLSLLAVIMMFSGLGFTNKEVKADNVVIDYKVVFTNNSITYDGMPLPQEVMIFVTTDNGATWKPAFCANPFVMLEDGQVYYPDENISGANNTPTAMILYHGFYEKWGSNITPEQAQSNQALLDDYTRTYALYYETALDKGGLGTTNTQITGSASANYSAWKQDVMRKVDSHYKSPSFDTKTYTMSIGDTIRITDTNGVFQDYKGAFPFTRNGVTYNKDGNDLVITANANATNSYIREKDNFRKWDTASEVNWVYRSDADTQDLFVGGFVDPVRLSVMVKLEKASLTVTKEDVETGSSSQGYGKLDKAVFDVTNDVTGQVVGTIQWENGQANTITDLPTLTNGGKTNITYTLTEKESTTGYHLGFWENGQLVNSKTFDFSKATSSDNGENIVKFSNETMKNSVTKTALIKVDENGESEAVKGTELQLINPRSWVVMEQWLYNGTPKEVLGLEIGEEYILRELRENDDFIKARDVRFVVDSKNEVQEIVMVNKYKEKEKPSLKTKATGINGEKVFNPTVDNELIDVVTFDNVDTSKTYDASMVFVNVKTGKEIVEVIEEDVTFDTPSGEYQMEFEIKANTIKDGDYVCYEYLKDAETGEIIVKHEDINDKDQTVHFETIKLPSLKTKATGVNGEKVFNPTVDNTLEDTVTFKNLDESKTYDLVLAFVSVDTGAVIIDESKEDVTFDESNGEYKMEFEVKANTLKDGDYVCFEYLKDKETGEVIVKHEDINDKDQTVRFETPIKETPKEPSKPVVPTGDDTNVLLYIGGIAIGSALFGLYLMSKKRNSKEVK